MVTKGQTTLLGNLPEKARFVVGYIRDRRVLGTQGQVVFKTPDVVGVKILRHGGGPGYSCRRVESWSHFMTVTVL